MTIAKDFTDKEREEFSNAFYLNWHGETDAEGGSPLPWGCPWLYNESLELEGNSIEEMANNYYETCKGDIEDLIANDSDDDE